MLGDDEFVRREYGRVGNLTYLDHAGAALYSASQIDGAFSVLRSQVLANPHSAGSDGVMSAPAVATSLVVKRARERVLSFLGVSPVSHSVVFTSGATAALKIVGECFGWSVDTASQVCFLHDNHNSALGVREYALELGLDVMTFDSEDAFISHVEEAAAAAAGGQGKRGPHLLVLPAQCNFSGVKHDLGVLSRLREVDPERRWKILLDAASFVPQNSLDLGAVPADFCAMSFYKIFGYPTGLGALVVRNDAAGSLSRKRYFGGGTVSVSISSPPHHVLREGVAERFEDGTVSFASIAALDAGFDFLKSIGGPAAVGAHAAALASRLAESLAALRHANGAPVCVIAGNHLAQDPEVRKRQGGCVAFNLKKADGSWVGYSWVGSLASLCGIQIRTGCLCNPGACHRFAGLSPEEVKANAKAGKVCWLDDMDLAPGSGKPTGAVRASFGIASRAQDVEVLLKFIRDNFVDAETGTSPWPVAPPNPPLTRASQPPPLLLSKIILYPVKSCTGFEVDSWEISPTSGALRYDREWALCDVALNPLTQKQHPKLCLVSPRVDMQANELRLSARAPGMADLVLPLPAADNDSCEKATQWFSKLLGVAPADCKWRRYDPSVTADAKRTKGGFLNTSNLLVLSQASLDDLHKRLPEESKGAIDLINFRPNLLVTGGAAYQEDKWKAVQVGQHILKGVGLCNRCVITCVDKRSASICREPLVTLARYRHIAGGVMFGLLADYVASACKQPFTISVNSRVIVLEESDVASDACKHGKA